MSSTQPIVYQETSAKKQTDIQSAVLELNPRETQIYNEIKAEYQKQPELFNQKTASFLTKNNLSLSEILSILQTKQAHLKLINSHIITDMISKPQAANSVPGTGLFGLIASIGSLALSGSAFALSYFIQQQTTPSLFQKITSYGLMGVGAITLIPEVVLESENGGIIMFLLHTTYAKLTHPAKKRQLHENSAEITLVESMIRELQEKQAELKTRKELPAI